MRVSPVLQSIDRTRRLKDGIVRSAGRPLFVQACLAACTLLVITIVPPAEGPMLILPLVPGSAADTINWAIGDGAAILAPGPSAGSLIVFGRRDRLIGSAVKHVSLLMNVPARLCGTLKRSRKNP